MDKVNEFQNKTKLLTAVKGFEPFPERTNLISFYRESISVFISYLAVDHTVWLAHIYNLLLHFTPANELGHSMS